MFDRLGTQHSLTRMRGQAESDLKRLLEQVKPKLNALKRRITDVEAKNRGDTEDYLTKHIPYLQRTSLWNHYMKN